MSQGGSRGRAVGNHTETTQTIDASGKYSTSRRPNA